MPRRLLLLALLCVLAGAIAPAAAQAVTLTSHLATPADGATLIGDATLTTPAQATYSGTTDQPATAIDIRCFRGGTSAAGPLATTTTDGTGAFSVTANVPSSLISGWCILRAVPSGVTTTGPEQTGPDVFVLTGVANDNAAAKVYDYYLHVPISRRVSFDFDSLGSCGLDDATSWNAEAQYSRHFYCNAWLYHRDVDQTRAGLILDGHNTVTPYSVDALSGGAGAAQPVLGFAHTFDPATKRTTITESDPLSRCNSDTLPIDTAPNCTTFTPAGVTVDRAIDVFPLTGPGTDETTGRVVITDTWKSTDGQAHTADVALWEDFQHQPPGPGFQLLGGSDPLAAWPAGSPPFSPASASAPASWLTQRRFGVPDSELDNWGVTTMYPAPSQIAFSANPNSPVATTHETFTIPAGGSVVRRHLYTVAGTQAQALALRASSEDLAVAPSVSASGPATVFGPKATVTGTVTDPGGTDTLTVAGAATALGAGGAFSHEVALQPDANAVLVRATDGVGQTAEQTVTITRVLPAITATTPTKQVRLTGTTTKSAKVTASINGPGTITIKLTAKIKTTKKVGGRKRTTTKTVTLGTGSLTVTAAGKRTVTVKLTKAGAKLVKQAGRKGLKTQALITGAFTPADTTTKTITLTLRT